MRQSILLTIDHLPGSDQSIQIIPNQCSTSLLGNCDFRSPVILFKPPCIFVTRIRRSAGSYSILATRGSPATDNPDDLDLAEFFVLRRSYRGCGVGHRAAFLLWDRLRGRWVVRVSEMNRGALPFWERTIREYTGGVFCEKEHRGKSHMFRVFSFSSVIKDATI